MKVCSLCYFFSTLVLKVIYFPSTDQKCMIMIRFSHAEVVVEKSLL